MPIPLNYSDADLLQYLHLTLHETAGVLGWSVAAGSYDDALTETLLAYGGVTEVGECTDLRKLRALARVSVWQAVCSATATDINFSADGGSYSRAQAHEHAVKMLEAAQAAALAYSPDYAIRTDTEVPQSPYRYQRGDEYAHKPGTYRV